MAAVLLGTKATGSTVKISIGGISFDFIVVQHGKASSVYDDSFLGTTTLLMKDIYSISSFASTNSNNWTPSSLKSFLDNTFYGRIDANIQSHIVQVKIPYVATSGWSFIIATNGSGLSCKVFIPSIREVNGTTAGMYGDGTPWAYFSDTPTSGAPKSSLLY